MTEILRLIELNEIEQIRVTCKKCSVAIKFNISDLSFRMQCPRCGQNYNRLHESLIDLKNALAIRKECEIFDVHIELKSDNE